VELKSSATGTGEAAVVAEVGKRPRQAPEGTRPPPASERRERGRPYSRAAALSATASTARARHDPEAAFAFLSARFSLRVFAGFFLSFLPPPFSLLAIMLLLEAPMRGARSFRFVTLEFYDSIQQTSILPKPRIFFEETARLGRLTDESQRGVERTSVLPQTVWGGDRSGV
jgi:hypothetical protein